MRSGGLSFPSVGDLVRGASRSWGQHRQCLARADSTRPVTPEEAERERLTRDSLPGIPSDSWALEGTSVTGHPGRDCSARPPRGSRGGRQGCGKQTTGDPTLAGVPTGASGWERGSRRLQRRKFGSVLLGVCQVDTWAKRDSEPEQRLQGGSLR